MQIEVIHEHPEDRLLERVEQDQSNHSNWGVVCFPCAQLGKKMKEVALLQTLQPLIGDMKSALYALDNGEPAVTFYNPTETAIEDVTAALYEHFNVPREPQRHLYFDAHAQRDELHIWCKRNALFAMERRNVITPDVPEPSLIASTEQRTSFEDTAYGRSYRGGPHIMIVEDQPFSMELLQSVLARNYRTFTATDARTAWERYIEFAPDIVFLDIELPGIHGHSLTASLLALDPKAFIVMVSGNNYTSDVLRSRKNGAKGFIVKPYNKQKIADAIALFIKTN
ncbi:MAG: response regulator [Rickettsiales bacterium]